MTLPDERYRSLRWAEQFMRDLLDPSKTARVPKAVRAQARSILRHYPSAYYLDQLAQARPDIITAEMEQLHRFVRQGTIMVDGHGDAHTVSDPGRDPSL